MSNRDKRRGADRHDDRRNELRLLEDEPVTDRFDQRDLWSQERPGRASHGRPRSRHYASAGDRRPRAGGSGGSGRGGSRGGGHGGEDWLLDEQDRPDWDREDWRDRYRALRARSRWPLAFTAAGVVLLFFGGLMLVQPPGTSGILGGAPCTTASCSHTTAPASVPARPSTSASTPAAVPPSPAPSASVSTRPSASASASGSASAATGPTTPATSVSPALRFVHVTYSLVRRWKNGFQGQFTIVNQGRTAISDWRLTVVLPNDHVESAWDASFQETGNTVTLIPPAYALSIAAGAKVTEQFTATGTTLRPVSCTFSGAPC
jgi:Cellulose binding domain